MYPDPMGEGAEATCLEPSQVVPYVSLHLLALNAYPL